MPHINLLPWREELRQERKKQFISMLVLALIVTAAGTYYALYLAQGMVSHQQARNDTLQQEIRGLERQISEIDDLRETRERLLARMRVIEDLQQKRTEIVHIFEELVETVPEGLYLTSVTQSGRNIELEGVAQSNARVSSYMNRLDASGWLSDPQLRVIETRGNQPNRFSEFSLRVRQTTPAPEEPEES